MAIFILIVFSVLTGLAGIWLLGDWVYAHRTLRRAASPTAPHATTEEIRLNPDGAPAILLIHGFADGASVFRFTATALAKAGHRVHALHLPGFGGPPQEMKGITLATWRDTCDARLNALFEQHTAPVWVLGHSLGGTLAMDLALRHPQKVAGVILLAPLLEPSRHKSPLLAPRVWFNILQHALVFTTIVESGLPKDIHDASRKRDYQTDRFLHRDVYQALFDAIDAVKPRAADWQGPLLMVLAANDRVVEVEASHTFFRAARQAAPALLVENKTDGHVLPLDAGHIALEEEILRFMQTAAPS